MIRRFLTRNVPLTATTVVFLLLYVICSARYDGFFSWFQFASLLSDNATLGLVAIGMTFVILSGGIDLSVGALLAFSSMLFSLLLTSGSMHWGIAIPCVLLIGLGFGAGMGAVIALFRLPPFIVTLAGMFLARGLALVLSPDKRISVSTDPVYTNLGTISVHELTLPALTVLVVAVIAVVFARSTRFGRYVYAVGGSETSALLMGVRVGRTKLRIYALSGFLAALAGIIQVIGTGAGDASVANTMELDAIASVVIGGTLLTGGSGHVAGTLLGVLILGIISTIPSYQGDLNSWWIKIGIGVLLLAFILLQRLVQSRMAR
ncbi:MAG: sugar ABC transporter permease YjfF [Planctomycetota bacterium]